MTTTRASRPTVRDCAGCYDDFYNNLGDGADGKPLRCWALADAKFVKALDVPVDLRPPYTRLKPTKRPSCYKAKGYCRVKPESLTPEGYWRT